MDDTLSPPVDAEAVVKSLPSLPLEIIYHIIKLSLPLVRFNTFRERYELLRTFSLVSKSWTSLAQAELWRHICVDSRDALVALHAAIAGSEASLAATRRVGLSIRLSNVASCWTIRDLQTLLGKLQSVQEAWVCNRDLQGPSAAVFGPSAFASHLKRLHLDVLVLKPKSTADVFPSLVELSISDPVDVDAAVTFLKHTTFPSLESLSFVYWPGLDSSEELKPINEVLRTLGPALKRFAFTISADSSCNLVHLDWDRFFSLRSLVFEVPPARDTSSILRKIPTKLETLRLRAGEGADEPSELLDALLEWPPALSALKALMVFRLGAVEEETLERSCAQRGVSVAYQAAGQTYFNSWEDLALLP
ncbi:hypothetical protein BCR35DRAFT_351211 [Leucosporidium creatinivorum]|uniref:F-box domain-containing protein n=1 Tax=Leucosporidium creatinivorum TaxID=106004 RepID=A0A1Y2FVQ7_9BASI|nr:hypothetical protein BCR35DRAFT_351211 [Leucosporidium creatinivorum]